MERKDILAKADEIGLSYQKNTPSDKLLQMIEDYEAGKEVPMIVEPEPQKDTISREDLEAQIRAEYEEKLRQELAMKLQEQANHEEINRKTAQTPYKPVGMIKAQKLREAKKLVRCVVTNRNPMKQGWEGEIISVSNDLGANERKYVPFGLTEGYHLPQIMINALNDKKCTIFVNKKGADGKLVKEGKLIKEYAIEILPPLTPEELERLADDQRARGSIDNAE